MQIWFRKLLRITRALKDFKISRLAVTGLKSKSFQAVVGQEYVGRHPP